MRESYVQTASRLEAIGNQNQASEFWIWSEAYFLIDLCIQFTCSLYTTWFIDSSMPLDVIFPLYF